MDTVLIYGSYGYTGGLISRRAVDTGIDLRVAGRDASEIERQKRDLGVGGEVFALDETDRMHAALDDIDVLLNCAGPFVHTADPLVDACLATETDYLDITGEFQVFKDIAERDSEATEAGVTLMPGVSFDVVTTDSMAAYLHGQLPSATELSLGIYSKMPVWEFAGGSLASGIEHAANDSGGALLGNTVVRREGELEVHRPAWKSREIDFGFETTPAVTIPWGDVVTAYHTTNIPNIDVYMGASRSERGMLKSMRYLKWFYKIDPVRHAAASVAQRIGSGPSQETRAADATAFWGQASDSDGNTVSARFQGPGVYETSTKTAVATLEHVLESPPDPGFQTPAGVYGPELFLDIEGVSKEDLVQPASE